MNDELREENHSAYMYHFFFNHGLFEEIIHLKDFIALIDEHLAEKLNVTLKGQNTNSYEPPFNPVDQYRILIPDILWRTKFLHCYYPKYICSL